MIRTLYYRDGWRLPKVNEKCGDMDTCGTKIYAYGYIAARRVLTFNVGAVIGRPQRKRSGILYLEKQPGKSGK